MSREHLSGTLSTFLKYAGFDTRSEMNAPAGVVSTPGQLELARFVRDDLVALGWPAGNISLNERTGLLLAALPATPGHEQRAHLCFSAHFDTYYGLPGRVAPIVHDYRGGDIVLPRGNWIIPAAELAPFVGRRVVTGSGDSCLGADDKAGLTGIVQLARRLLAPGAPAHGPLSLALFSDEETSGLDPASLPRELVNQWSVLWTVDGEEVGTVDEASQVIHTVRVSFRGTEAHPGDGAALHPAHYGAAVLVANLDLLWLTPWRSAGREGFQYAPRLEGNASEATVTCVPRSFSLGEAAGYVAGLRDLAARIAHERGLEVEINDELSCTSTEFAIAKRPGTLVPAMEALAAAGFQPIRRSCRGGTDGGMLNLAYPDLPAPNLGCGGRRLHQIREWLPADELEALPDILLGIVSRQP